MLLCVLFSTVSFAQETIEPAFPMPRTTIKMAPFKFFERTLELGVEAFNKDYSRSLNVDLGFKSGDESFKKASGYNFEVGYRRYASAMKFRQKEEKNFYRGIYYSVSVRMQYFKGEDGDHYYYNESYQKTTAIAPAFSFGWQRTLWEALVLDVYVGGAMRFAKTEYGNGETDNGSAASIFDRQYSGIMPKVGVKLGIGL